MKSRNVELIGVLLIGLVAFVQDVPVDGAESTSRVGDVVCGPRCVQFVLREHGIEADLIELVKEMQWPNIESGTTLDRVRAVLKERGVITDLVSIPKDSAYAAPSSAIIHIPDPKGDLGHFAVLLPSNNSEEVTLWLGVAGVRKMKLSEFHKTHSGLALIATVASAEDGAAFVRSRNTLWCALAGVVVVTTAVLICAEFIHDRTVRSAEVPKEQLMS